MILLKKDAVSLIYSGNFLMARELASTLIFAQNLLP
jgi:hypothetical protein